MLFRSQPGLALFSDLKLPHTEVTFVLGANLTGPILTGYNILFSQ